ncbi:hypothetical protein Cni_G19617 [Canna indica]|uniref:Uncharacterized protein n=1 Tax=Canna indica TaxID=4628 RepID=A0AAQ3QIT0_9LILI|nr:hypothetical protein Cni_G19617 [Canna indica]
MELVLPALVSEPSGEDNAVVGVGAWRGADRRAQRRSLGSPMGRRKDRCSRWRSQRQRRLAGDDVGADASDLVIADEEPDISVFFFL